MKDRWEYNINVWFPFMYSQKWSCYFQNRIIMFCLPVPTLLYLWEIYIYFQDRSAYPGVGKYVVRSWEYIIAHIKQIHEFGNWDWGRAIPRKGIHKWDFQCSLRQAQSLWIYWCCYIFFQPIPAPVRCIKFGYFTIAKAGRPCSQRRNAETSKALSTEKR